MTYKQKLTKVGNSIGLSLPKKIRALLNHSLWKVVYLLSGNDKQSTAVSIQKPRVSIDATFLEVLRSVDKEYSDVLSSLASQ